MEAIAWILSPRPRFVDVQTEGRTSCPSCLVAAAGPKDLGCHLSAFSTSGISRWCWQILGVNIREAIKIAKFERHMGKKHLFLILIVILGELFLSTVFLVGLHLIRPRLGFLCLCPTPASVRNRCSGQGKEGPGLRRCQTLNPSSS